METVKELSHGFKEEIRGYLNIVNLLSFEKIAFTGRCIRESWVIVFVVSTFFLTIGTLHPFHFRT